MNKNCSRGQLGRFPLCGLEFDRKSARRSLSDRQANPVQGINAEVSVRIGRWDEQ
jgi:hypothetical protein